MYFAILLFHLLDELINLHFHQQKVIRFDITMDDFTGMQIVNNVQYLACKMHNQTLMHDLNDKNKSMNFLQH